MTHPFAFDVNQQTISGPKVYTAVCASHAGISVAMVCCTTRVDSRIPQDSSQSPRNFWFGVLGTKGRHTCVPTPLSKSCGDLATLGSPTTMRPAGSLGRTRDHPKQSSNKRSVGDTPLSEVSKALVIAHRRHPPSGGVPLRSGSPRVCSWMAGGAVLDGRVRSWAAGPLSTACPPGPALPGP